MLKSIALINNCLKDLSSDYFVDLAQKLCDITQVQTVIIKECNEFPSVFVKTLAFHHDSELKKSIQHSIINILCEKITHNGACFFPSDIQRLYPKDKLLVDLKVESYCSVPITNNALQIIGYIIILHNKPLESKDKYIRILELFSKQIALEITHKKTEQDLKESEEKFRAFYNNTPAMFFNTDEKGNILLVNKYGANRLGYEVNELIGKNIDSIVHPDDLEAAKEKIKQSFDSPDIVYSWEIKKAHKNGHIIIVSESVRVTYDEAGDAVLFISGEDITEAFQLSEQLSFQATHDALTGLVNRLEFERRLNLSIETNQKDSTEGAVCYLDLDQFKIINDTCGHLAGDELLRQLSEQLLTRVRQRDTLARLGGDEFGVLMEDCNIEQAWKVSEALRKIVENFYFSWDNKKFNIGVSIGLVPVTLENGNTTEILSAADAACYAAKDAGRNRVHLYSGNDAEMCERIGEMQWISRINEALDKNLFTLFHQKIIKIESNKNSGDHFELLIRMKTNAGEIIPPGSFLAAAERYGLATKIDRWVIDSALVWLEKNQDKQNKLVLLNINLSGQSLSNEEFMNYLSQKLDNNHDIAHKICFEITETSLVSNLYKAINFIEKVKAKGCSFAIDDFGSGFSSFDYLKKLPVEYLKIEGSFVRDITNDQIGRAMVKSINEIGQLMGKKTIAEFVEDDATLNELRKLGVDYAQGYGIGKPKELI